MHHMSWEHVSSRLRPGSFVVVNENAVEGAEFAAGRIVGIPVDDLAAELGAPGAASFVMLGAFGGLTAVVTTEQLKDAMRVLVPPYRSNLIAANQLAIEAGFAAGRACTEEVTA
jgi:Pyruvate/2-oxoacid:ferredoxin oxidoreductase gamma subunit